jgi:hypothetical protein
MYFIRSVFNMAAHCHPSLILVTQLITAVVMLECYLNCTMKTVQGSMPLDNQVTRTYDTVRTHSPCMV